MPEAAGATLPVVDSLLVSEAASGLGIGRTVTVLGPGAGF